MVLRLMKHPCSMALVLSLCVPAVSSAQLGGLGRRAVAAANRELGREIDRLVREGVRCVFDDLECVEKAKAEGKTPVMTDRSGRLMTDPDGRPLTDPAEAAEHAGPAERPGTGAWVNYDFVPGDRILFYDDFSGDRVGDFPRRFELAMGNWEVAEWQGQRFLRATANGAVSLVLPETLPERFTIEFPASVQHGNAYVRVSTAPLLHDKREYAGSTPSLEFARAGLRAMRGQGPLSLTPREKARSGAALVNVRIMADGDYMKMYLDEQRVANAPNAVFPRTDRIFLSISSASDKSPIMIGPVRIAAGGRDLYAAIERDGRVSLQGILFATNSDVIRPESTPTLKEIGDMLEAHADLRLSIEGHTDSEGEEAYNLALSGRRAAAVKAYLVESFGIDGSRLATTGLGESKPVADNSTPEGRQKNRRVELVRQGG